ncbi:hypothetical protein QQ020_27130 [Fulvivirgaceae bacterium BMA12]|uniref:Phage protein n=1 Tax=Agaribacillus aureus TaxID=3051825 RepID=A0ABT8LDD7_9BACT|nr:hypothetical protein [Fulvivirgaceae bacterium BMA12]
MAMSFDNIRTGKKYYLKNFGEESTFEVHEVMGNGDYRVKDIHTLEMFFLSELIKYGKGKDYTFEEVPG